MMERFVENYDNSEYPDSDVAEYCFDEWLIRGTEKYPKSNIWNYRAEHTWSWVLGVMVYQIKCALGLMKFARKGLWRKRFNTIKEAFSSVWTLGSFTLSEEQLRDAGEYLYEWITEGVNDYRYDSDPRNHPSLSAAQRN